MLTQPAESHLRDCTLVRWQGGFLNCKRCSALADRVYIYDNSIDDADARLLFRMTDGQLFKQYTDDIPEWAKTLIDV